jgi:cohesin loading factor subunit SCC2
MLLPIVTKAVSKRLVDDSISVREAVVSLVGTYVAQSPAVANSFHASLLPCLSDSGVSVRKRAVRIFQDVLTSNPRYTGRSVVCRLMLERALDPKEEDTVRDIIYELFGKLWLEDGEAIFPVIGTAMPLPIPHEEVDTLCTGPVSPNAASIAGRAGFVTPTPTISALSKKNSLPQKRADIAAEQMMEVVRAGGTNEHLEALLHKLLDAKKDGNEGQKKSLRRKGQARGGKQIENLVNSLFELLLAIEEQRTARGPCIGKDIAATLQVIVTFAEISPNMVLTHVDTLLPYLKVDNGVAQDESAAIVGAACDVLYQLASTLGKGAASLLSSKAVGHDLRQVTYCLSADASESAIRAWSTIIQNQEGCHESAFAKELFKVAHAFYSYLYKSNNISDFSTVDVSCSPPPRPPLVLIVSLLSYNGFFLLYVDESSWQCSSCTDNSWVCLSASH